VKMRRRAGRQQMRPLAFETIALSSGLDSQLAGPPAGRQRCF